MGVLREFHSRLDVTFIGDSAMDYQYVLDRLDSIHSELITLSSEACYGARGRLAVRHIVAAITEVHIARVHVAGQQLADARKPTLDLLLE